MAKQSENFPQFPQFPLPQFDVTRFLTQVQLPNAQIESLLSSQRKNLEALTAANQLAYDGMQAVLSRQAELLRQAVDEVANVTRDLSSPGMPHEKAAKQAELARDAFERTVTNMRELAEMVARSNTEAADLLNKRFTESLTELRDLMLQQPKKK